MDRQTMLSRFDVAQMQDFLTFLDDLRESRTTNMFSAGIDLREEFDVTKDESHAILAHWMETFANRYPK